MAVSIQLMLTDKCYIGTDKHHREKKILKNTMCFFKQIVGATTHIIAAVWPLASHLKNHSDMIIRHAGHCWRRRDRLISHILLWTPTHGGTSLGRLGKTYINQLFVDTGCNLVDLPGTMRKTDDEKESGNSLLSAPFDDDDEDIVFCSLNYLEKACT